MGCSIIYLAIGGRKRGCSRLPFPWQKEESGLFHYLQYLAKGGRKGLFHYLPGNRREEEGLFQAPLSLAKA